MGFFPIDDVFEQYPNKQYDQEGYYSHCNCTPNSREDQRNMGTEIELKQYGPSRLVYNNVNKIS